MRNNTTKKLEGKVAMVTGASLTIHGSFAASDSQIRLEGFRLL